MTLVVSLRVTDGVVLAADSLATSLQVLGMQVAAEKTCPSCNERVEIKNVMQNLRAHPPCPKCSMPIEVDQIPEPRVNLPISATSFAQKVFPFLGIFGVAQYGATAMGSRTIYSILKSLELTMREERQNGGSASNYRNIDYVADRARKTLQSHFDKEMSQHVSQPGFPAQLFGVQIVGFAGPADPTPVTIEMSFGKAGTTQKHAGLGISASGDWKFTEAFLTLCNDNGCNPEIAHFGLQDAIEYSEYLVGTMIGMQRFASRTPTVGGAVDIALLAPYSSFRWIKAKELARILEPDTGATT